MYISQLKLWNFRIYGNNLAYESKKDNPDLLAEFQSGLNALVGENDAGKSAIIDAIRLTLGTHAFEKNSINSEDDFHEFFMVDDEGNRLKDVDGIDQKKSHDRLRIEIRFDGLTDNEAKNFIEWLGRENDKPYLRLIYDIKKGKGNKISGEIKAGCDSEGYPFNSEARELLKCTYLKPLRDAESELNPGRNSRLGQILRGRSELQENKSFHDDLVNNFNKHKKSIKESFETGDGKNIYHAIKKGTNTFTNQDPNFGTNKHNIGWILDLLKIGLGEDTRAGLGSNNMLYMAVEMLHLEKETEYSGLKLGLIEELEAHLHPQAQLRVIKYLEELSENQNENIQLIITTHSPNLASMIKIEKLIYCFRNGDGSKAYSLKKSGIEKTDLLFLERYLDVTKANLFFAKGIIFVEGPTEEILLITIAILLGIDLYQKGVSLISVGGTYFFNYANVFSIKNDNQEQQTYIPLKVSIITDLDLRPDEYATKKGLTTQTDKKNNKIKSVYTAGEITAHSNGKKKNDTSTIKTFISPERTLEYCLAKSCLGKLFKIAALEARKLDFIDPTKIQEIETKIRDIINNYGVYVFDPFELYWAILGEENIYGTIGKSEISKPLITQILSLLIFEKKIKLQKIDRSGLEDIDISALIPTKNNIESDPCISYLIQAIIHVCGTNTTIPTTDGN